MKLFYLVLLSLVSCQKVSDSARDVLLLRLILKNSEQVTLSGVVRGPGSIKNAQVDLVLPKDGKCVDANGKPNGQILASTKSAQDGSYSLSYTKQNQLLCVVVTPIDATTMAISYGNKQDVSWGGKLYLSSIFKEPKAFKRNSTGQLNARKRVNVTPFTRLVASRFSASKAGGSKSSTSFFSFLRSGFTKALQSEEELLESAAKDVAQTFFKGTSIKNFQIEELNPDAKSYEVRNGAISVIAERLTLGKGSKTSQLTGNVDSENLQKVLDFIERDFSDGQFDGKKITDKGEIESISAAELSEINLNTQSADRFLKEEFTQSLKDFAKLHPNISDNFWRSVQLCDADDENCNSTASTEGVYVYPENGATNVSNHFFAFLSFSEEVDISSISAQSQSGTCSGTIQLSHDEFNTCLGLEVEKEEWMAIIYLQDTTLTYSQEYKLKILSTIKTISGNSLLNSNLVSTFTTSAPLVNLGNDTVYHDDIYAVWTRCALDLNSGIPYVNCSSNSSPFKYCNSNDNSCNGGEIGNLVSSGPIYDACNYLNTIQFGGLTGWRVPEVYEWESLLDHTTLANSIFSPNSPNTFWFADSDLNDPTKAYYWNSSSQQILTQSKNTSGGLLCITYDVPL